MTTASSENPKRSGWWLIRWTIAALVAAALFYTIKSSADQFSELNFRAQDIRCGWLVLALVCYVSAMLAACLFWNRVLTALGCRTSWPRALSAFFLSQLGKYVPGKALVVVIRTDICADEQSPVGPVVASVFVETLTWIFVGSVIASILIAFQFEEQTALKWTALSMAVVFGVLTLPPVFRFLASRLTRTTDPKTFAGLNVSTMLFGWVVMSIGWLLNGLSLWLVLFSLPETATTAADFPLTLACVSLATVAGFASLLPGGIGVRELVMIPLLGPRFGAGTAIVAAILIRLVWLSAEILCNGIIYSANRLAERTSTT